MDCEFITFCIVEDEKALSGLYHGVCMFLFIVKWPHLFPRYALLKLQADRCVVLKWLSKDFMLWPGTTVPPDLYRGAETSVGERAGVLTLDRQRDGRDHGGFRGMLLPCPCTGPPRMGNNCNKQRPKTQWYIKVGQCCCRCRQPPSVSAACCPITVERVMFLWRGLSLLDTVFP
jgi:hypothetical protein